MGIMMWVWWKMRKALSQSFGELVLGVAPRFVGCVAHLVKWEGEGARG